MNFFSTAQMGGFTYWFLPLITSITGILFWHTVASYIEETMKENRKITFVAKNTFSIMESHLMFANIINILFYELYKNNVIKFQNFDCGRFLSTAWNGAAWLMMPFSGILGFILGMVLSILLAIMLNKIKMMLIIKFHNN